MLPAVLPTVTATLGSPAGNRFKSSSFSVASAAALVMYSVVAVPETVDARSAATDARPTARTNSATSTSVRVKPPVLDLLNCDRSIVGHRNGFGPSLEADRKCLDIPRRRCDGAIALELQHCPRVYCYRRRSQRDCGSHVCK